MRSTILAVLLMAGFAVLGVTATKQFEMYEKENREFLQRVEKRPSNSPSNKPSSKPSRKPSKNDDE
jgi:hypothetical protein